MLENQDELKFYVKDEILHRVNGIKKEKVILPNGRKSNVRIKSTESKMG